MVLPPDDDSDELIRVSMQITRRQYVWLQKRAQRLSVRSVPAINRMLIQEAINTEQVEQRDGAAA